MTFKIVLSFNYKFLDFRLRYILIIIKLKLTDKVLNKFLKYILLILFEKQDFFS